MNCEACGRELPLGAMFCGECGRAVGSRSLPLSHVDSGMPIARALRPAAGDTMIIEPVDLDELAAMVAGPRGRVEREPPRESAPRLEAEEPPVALREDEIEPGIEFVPRIEEQAHTDEQPHIEDEERIDAAPEIESERDDETGVEPDIAARVAEVMARFGDAAEAGRTPDRSQAANGPDPFPWGIQRPVESTEPDDLDGTILVPRREAGERFVLQFSTGESVTVFGSGLLGRNPVPQPGEYFDQLVAISDPGKSVSKTHLEFGQEGGAFWVGDRFSGNGSVVREPESAPHRLTAGKRYRIVRGTRVDIGEQFFIVS